MTGFVERVLRLHPGEGRRGLLLFAYLFLVIASLVASKATRDAMFLERHPAVALPYVDIAIAVIVGAVMSLYLRLARRVSLPLLQAGSLWLLAAVSLTFWELTRAGAHSDTLVVIIYVWVGILGVVTPAQVWMLANFMVTTRGGKRVFAVIGSGAIAGSIAGGLLVRTTVERLGAENTLAGVAVALCVSGVLVLVIWRDRPAGLAIDQTEAGSRPSLLESLRLVSQSPHLRSIAALILIASFVTTIAGWQFKAIAKAQIPETNALAAFFGSFSLYAGLASLAAQLLLTAPLLRTFGIGVGLVVVPALMGAGTAGVLVTGGLTAAIVLKGSDQVMRYSIDKAALELLYLPLTRGVTFQAKSVIDTVIWRCGDGLAGLLVLLFAGWLRLSPPELGWINVPLIAIWIGAAMAASRHYVRALTNSIHQHRLEVERSSEVVLDRTSLSVIAERLGSGDTAEVLFTLDLLQAEHGRRSHPAVLALLAHPHPDIRARAIRLLADAGDTTVIPRIEALLHDDRLAVRTEALLFLTQHAGIDPLERLATPGDYDDFSIQAGMVAFLARPGKAQSVDVATLLLDRMVRSEGEAGRRTRLEAARLLRWLPGAYDASLRELLHDDDAEIVREAASAAGAMRAVSVADDIVGRLGEPLIVPDAVDALASFGDSIVDMLRERLADATVPREIRREIPQVLLRIGTPAAFGALVDNLADPDERIRFRIIIALNKLAQSHPDWRVDERFVETILNREIEGLYVRHQLVDALQGQCTVPEHALPTLADTIDDQTERIFRLLKLRHPETDLHSVHVGLRSPDVVVHDNALELIDTAVPQRLTGLLVPLLDGAVSAASAARSQVARRVIGIACEAPLDVPGALPRLDDPKLRELVRGSLAAECQM